MATGLEIKYKRRVVSVHGILIVAFLALGVLSLYYGYRWYTTGEQPPIPIPVSVAAAYPSVSTQEVTADQKTNYSVPALHPKFLSVPALGIDRARIFPAGTTETGELDTPDNIYDVAWFTRSVSPGQGSGAVLLDGHNGGFAKDGVFAKLDTLPNGSQMTIERGDGKQFTYEVVENRNMPLNEVNKTGMKEMMYSAQPDKEGLNIITCAGRYIPKDKLFDHRIMLRAVRVK